MSTPTSACFAAIVTAAGASTRMGSPKALAPYGGVPLLLHQLRVLEAEAAIDPIVVVLGSEADALAAEIAGWHTRARVVVNARWEEGRSSSLEVGAAAIPGTALGVLVVAVDQPLERAVVRALLDAGPSDAVTAPSFAGRRGHPVLLPGALLGELARASSHPEGLRDIVRAAATRLVEVASPRVLLDLNTPEDLARAGAEIAP